MQRRLDAILDDDDYHTLIATGAFSVSSELASVRSMKMAPEEFLLRGAAVVGLGPGNDERGTQLRQERVRVITSDIPIPAPRPWARYVSSSLCRAGT